VDGKRTVTEGGSDGWKEEDEKECRLEDDEDRVEGGGRSEASCRVVGE